MVLRFNQMVLLSLVVLLGVLVLLHNHQTNATGLPSGGGGCCCCQQQAAPAPPPPPPQQCCCCGRKKRQMFSALAEMEKYMVDQERRMYCCGSTGRKRRHTGQPVSRRVEFWGGGSQLSSMMFH
ncbi:hypothetical protein GPALN_006884 [Globodera pallida]|nr:hypothetical protein GPALN_006884 [Globodera pallida]